MLLIALGGVGFFGVYMEVMHNVFRQTTDGAILNRLGIRSGMAALAMLAINMCFGGAVIF